MPPQPAVPDSGRSAFAALAGSRSARPAAQCGFPFPATGGGVLVLRLPRKLNTSPPSCPDSGVRAGAAKSSFSALLIPSVRDRGSATVMFPCPSETQGSALPPSGQMMSASAAVS